MAVCQTRAGRRAADAVVRADREADLAGPARAAAVGPRTRRQARGAAARGTGESGEGIRNDDAVPHVPHPATLSAGQSRKTLPARAPSPCQNHGSVIPTWCAPPLEDLPSDHRQQLFRVRNRSCGQTGRFQSARAQIGQNPGILVLRVTGKPLGRPWTRESGSGGWCARPLRARRRSTATERRPSLAAWLREAKRIVAL